MTLAYCTSACHKIDPPDSNGATEHHDLRVGTACPFHQNCIIHSGGHHIQPVFGGIDQALTPAPEVSAAWLRAHGALQAQLEFFHERKATGTLEARLHLEGGVPRVWKFDPHMREQVGSREAGLKARRR